MKCPRCEHENLPQAKFCAKCGAELPSAAPVPPTPTTNAVSKELKIGIIVGTVFIPLLGIIMGVIYMNDPNPEKKAVGRLWLYVGIGMIALGCLCYAIMIALGAAGGVGQY
jgi:hypothetical protein